MFARRRFLPAFCLVAVLLGLVVIGVCRPADAAPPARPVDVSKLKKGDKLEVQVGRDWVPAEFVDQFSKNIIHVMREPYKIPVGAIVSSVRLPAKSRKAAATAENPFETEVKPRTWSDESGKFKIEATLLRVESENAILNRTDGKVIAVPLDRLSGADRKYLDSIGGGDSAAAGHDDDEPAEPEIPLVETNLGAAELIELSGGEWTYQPDKAPAGPSLRNVRLPLAPMDFFDRPQRILLSPTENRAFVVTFNQHGGQKFGVQAIDVQRGRVTASGLFSTTAEPIAVSPDGKLILARTKGFGTGTSAELRLYSRKGTEAKPEKAWAPYSHHGQSEESLHGTRYPWDADVEWADFLDSERIITISHAGELAVWQVADLEPIYQAKVARSARPAVSRGGKYLAVTAPEGIAILQADNGKPAGLLSAELSHMERLDFSPSGNKLAVVSPGRLRVWDLTTQKLERDFPVRLHIGLPNSSARDIAWLDDRFLLVGGSVIVPDDYATAWVYSGITPWVEYGGRIWFIAGQSRSFALTSGTVPSPAVRKEWSTAPKESMLAIQPGMEISVELQTSDPQTAEVREHIVKSLTERGLKVVPQSDVKLVGTIAPGKVQDVTYRTFGAPRAARPPRLACRDLSPRFVTR